MKVLVTGSSGFIGSKLVEYLLQNKTITIGKREEKISELCLLDVIKSNIDSSDYDTPILNLVGSLNNPQIHEYILDFNPEIIIHLASIVSSHAEREFLTGIHVNLQGTLKLLDTAKVLKTMPVFIMTSSLAVFGGQLPQILDDDYPVCPQSSYGTQKAMCELLINDFSRKQYIDGRVLRLPTVVVRPGKPNAAASSFMSGIIREPLNGEIAECYVPKDFKVWIVSPTKVVHFLLHSISLATSEFTYTRVLNMPGISVSIDEMIRSLVTNSNNNIETLIKFVENKSIYDIVASWPINIETTKANQLGFVANKNIDEIVKEYIQNYK